jgi:hypothetical protein
VPAPLRDRHMALVSYLLHITLMITCVWSSRVPFSVWSMAYYCRPECK